MRGYHFDQVWISPFVGKTSIIPLLPNHPNRIREKDIPRNTSCILKGFEVGVGNQPLSNALGKEGRIQIVNTKMKPYWFNHIAIPESMR